jgi:hypothetical protein
MKKTMKRILAFVLTFLMCASLAAPVFAADDAACPGVGAIHEKANCDATKIGEHVPTCGEQGYTVYKCNGCGTYFADDIYESDKEHVWVEGSYDETCEKDGYKGLVCEVCDSNKDQQRQKVIDDANIYASEFEFNVRAVIQEENSRNKEHTRYDKL